MGSIPEVVMRGPSVIRDLTMAFLQSVMPGLIDVARDQWSVDADYLPYFRSFDVYEPSLITNDQYPGLGMYPATARDFVRDDYLPSGAQKYEAKYSMQLMVVARTPRIANDTKWADPPKQTATRLRDDLTSLVQAALLQTPSLNSNGRCSIDENTMQVTYLDPMMPNSQGTGRWIAASIISAEFRLTEVTYALPYGTADTVIVETALLDE